MVKKHMTPCPFPKRGLPCELKYDFAMRAYSNLHRAYLYAIREKYGADTALEIYERTCKMDDRTKRLTNNILTIFNLEGNDAETIGEWWDVFWELMGAEGVLLERSKTINRIRITQCPNITEPKDVSDWCKYFFKIGAKTINPKATVERPKGMCAGDSYCEYVWRIEE